MNNTWSLQPLPLGKQIVGCHWVYKDDGTLEWHKACLVAQGFTQQVGEDFIDTFSLVAKPTTLCIMCLFMLKKVGNFCNLTSITLSYMGIWMKKYV